ncbi:MAG: hypothetical protein Q4D05_07150, partial [Acinetobacter sp.]|nr:hypothetical protein [Acinetobacter sp.]
ISMIKGNTMKKWFGMMLLLLASSVSDAANWVYFATAQDDTKHYIDADRISVNDSQITVWEKYYFKVAQKAENGKFYRYAISKNIYDCSDNTLTLTQGYFYSNKGVIVDSFSWHESEYEWNDVIPDSVASDILEQLCEANQN